MSHRTNTKPYWVLWGGTQPQDRPIYWCDPTPTNIYSDLPNYAEFDTEDELATQVNTIVGQGDDWYWQCDKRIPYPPNLTVWDNCDDEPV